MASYRDDISAYRRIKKANGQRPEIAGSSMVNASELRERAARYRQLAEILFDPHVVAEVQACARELDMEASWIERQASFAKGTAIQRYRIG